MNIYVCSFCVGVCVYQYTWDVRQTEGGLENEKVVCNGMIVDFIAARLSEIYLIVCIHTYFFVIFYNAHMRYTTIHIHRMGRLLCKAFKWHMENQIKLCSPLQILSMLNKWFRNYTTFSPSVKPMWKCNKNFMSCFCRDAINVIAYSAPKHLVHSECTVHQCSVKADMHTDI